MERELYRPVAKPLYALQVPSGNNAAEVRLMELCAKIAGGCSKREVDGVWRDPKVNQTIWEPITEFQFSCESDECAAIVYETMILYPNERAFYLARIGKAEILERAEYIVRAGVRARVDAVGKRGHDNELA